VDVARLPDYQGGFKGILANSTTKVLHGVAAAGNRLCSIVGWLRSDYKEKLKTTTMMLKLAGILTAFCQLPTAN